MFSSLPLQDILTEALSAPWSPAQVEILEQTLGHETVLEAVKRNEAEVSQRALGGTIAAAAGPRCSADSAASTASAYSPPEVQLLGDCQQYKNMLPKGQMFEGQMPLACEPRCRLAEHSID